MIAAQSCDQHAIDRLCEAFRPLIKQEAYRSYVIGKLGADAENTAWEIFLEFIHNYKGNKFRLLPGLIQRNLYYKLMHVVYPENPASVQAELVLDATDAEGKRLIDVPYNNKAFDCLANKSFVNSLLQCLTAKQRDIILSTILGEQTLDEYRLQHSISFKVAYLRQQTALAKLKEAVRSIS